MQIELLKQLGFSDKIASIYLALLRLGPSSVRTLAEKTNLNRGTIYDNLKWLQDKKLVGFYKKNSKQLFVVENPEKLHSLVENKTKELEETDKKLSSFIPELKSLYNKGGEQPISKYYSKEKLQDILQDIIEVCENDEDKEYRIYSSAGIREYLYDNFPTFSDVRISKGIKVKVIAIGEGGKLRGMDDRKWMKSPANHMPTYILIYPGKTAYISLNAKDEPVGVVIENPGVYQTQKIIFDNLWDQLD